MRITRKGAGIVGLGLGVAIVAGACAGGAGAADVVDVATPEGASRIAAAQRVGAMENFSFGDTFRATEPIDIGLMYRVHPNFQVQDDWLIFRALEENQNVTFNRTDVLLADWDNRRSMLIATGDHPQIVGNVWPGQQNNWMTGGALLPVSDYFAYMPHLSHFIEEWDLWGQMENHRAADTGAIYMFPDFREAPVVSWGFIINEDLFRAAGVTEDPATFEELGAALRAIQATGQVDFAFSDRWTDAVPMGGAFNFVGPSFDTQGGWALSATRWDPEADQFIGTAMSDNYRDMIAFFAGLVADGAMTPDITQSDDQALESFINGRSAIISGNPGALAEIRQAASEAGVELNARMMVTPNANADWLAGGRLGPGMVLNSTVANDPNFLAILQFIDWFLYSEEGRAFNFWGIEGETFEYDAAGNRRYVGNIVGDGRDAIADGITDDVRLNLNETFGFQDGFWGYPGSGSAALVQSLMTEEQRAFVSGTVDSKTVMWVAPAAPLSELEQEEVGILETAINDFVHGQTGRFITGDRPMSQWDDFRAELQNMGIDRVLEIRNGALARARG